MKPAARPNSQAWRVLALVAGLCGAAAWPARVSAQVDTVQAARRLRDAGRFPDAAAQLRAYLASHPGDGEAARLLSETLYWAKDPAGARAVAEASLTLHPEDTSLRLEYGRMLVELGDRARALEVLAPLRESPQRGRAAGLLGTLAYWNGDLTAAKSLFVQSLREAPGQGDIRRQLGEILALSAPWVATGFAFKHDDQPVSVRTMAVEAGWFATPLVRIAARIEPMAFRLGDSATRAVTTAEVGVTSYLSPAGLELELAAGALGRSFGSASDWGGRAALGLRLPAHVTVRARVERSPYLYTEASLSTPVMTTTGAVLAHLSTPRGWLAEAAVQTQRFPDANSVNTVYAWILVPVVRDSGGGLQLGYSGSRQDAEASRLGVNGRYVPYYTPDELVTHSAVAAATVRLVPSLTFRVNGSYAFRAEENTTTFAAAGSTAAPAKRVVTRHAFTPWNARAALEFAGDNGLTLITGGEIARTAFYTSTILDVRVTYHFGLTRRRTAAGF